MKEDGAKGRIGWRLSDFQIMLTIAITIIGVVASTVLFIVTPVGDLKTQLTEHKAMTRGGIELIQQQVDTVKENIGNLKANDLKHVEERLNGIEKEMQSMNKILIIMAEREGINVEP